MEFFFNILMKKDHLSLDVRDIIKTISYSDLQYSQSRRPILELIHPREWELFGIYQCNQSFVVPKDEFFELCCSVSL